jgi:carbon starvation protein
LPLTWLATITSTAAWLKLTSTDPKVGFFAAANDLAAKLATGVLPPEKAAVAPQLIFNQRLDGWLALFFLCVVWFVILDMARVSIRYLRGMTVTRSSEAPYEPSRLASS